MNEKESISVGVRELKARLSEFLRMVGDGKVVTVTVHGRPIGRLVPYSESLEDRMQQAVDAGVLAWEGARWEPAGPVAKVVGDRSVSDLILEERH